MTEILKHILKQTYGGKQPQMATWILMQIMCLASLLFGPGGKTSFS